MQTTKRFGRTGFRMHWSPITAEGFMEAPLEMSGCKLKHFKVFQARWGLDNLFYH